MESAIVGPTGGASCEGPGAMGRLWCKGCKHRTLRITHLPVTMTMPICFGHIVRIAFEVSDRSELRVTGHMLLGGD